MLDVVPPEAQAPSSSSRRRRHNTLPDNGVVEIDWRLPARLRRPVREELQRQRRRRRQREAIVQFKRHSLYPTASSQPSIKKNVGAEHHTGDVYRESRPFIAASVPPYAGSFLRGKVVASPRASKKQQPASTLPTAVTPTPRSTVASRPQKHAAPPRVPVPTRRVGLPGERDVPYQWAAAQVQQVHSAPPTVAPPRRRFALPLHLSIWPFKSASTSTSKKKVHPNSRTSLSS